MIYQVASATNSAGRDFLQINGTLSLQGANPITIKLVSMVNSNTPGLVRTLTRPPRIPGSWVQATGLTIANTNLVLDATAFANAYTGTFSLALDMPTTFAPGEIRPAHYPPASNSKRY